MSHQKKGHRPKQSRKRFQQAIDALFGRTEELMHGMPNDWDDDWNGQPWRGLRPAPPPETPPDPAFVRAVTDYRIYTGPDSLRGLNKPLTWFMARNGIVPVRVAPLGTFVGGAVAPVGKDAHASLLGLEALMPAIELNVPRLPWTALVEVIAFFRAHKETEAMVQFFYDPAANGAPDGYVAHVPTQQVSGGGVHHQGHFDPAGQLIHVLDIHSHSTMAPFWSGTDDQDERRFEGRLFGVIGYNDKRVPGMKWRTCVAGAFVDLDITHVVEVDARATMHIAVQQDMPIVDLLRAATDKSTDGRIYVDADPFADATFPPTWSEAVRTWSVSTDDKDRYADLADPHITGFRLKMKPTWREEREYKARGFVEEIGSGGLRWTRTTDSKAKNTTPTNTGGRPQFVYDAKRHQLYFTDRDGQLYKSHQKLADLPRHYAVTYASVDPATAKDYPLGLSTGRRH